MTDLVVQVLMAVLLVKPVTFRYQCLKSEIKVFRLTQRGSENGKGSLMSASSYVSVNFLEQIFCIISFP